MIVAVLVAPHALEIQNRRLLVPAAHEAIVRVDFAGVCGTDLALHSGAYPTPLPLVLGHEFVGRVDRVGEDVESVWIGRRVTAEINNSCRATGVRELCPTCRRDLGNHCPTRTTTGILRHDGAFAEEIAVPSACLHAIPNAIPDHEAVFIEPVAAALQTFEMSPLGRGDTVVVLGAGRLGYLIAGVAHALGARVFVTARSADKIARAIENLDVRALQLTDPDALAKEVFEWTGGVGADHVVEATGSGDSDVLRLAMRLVRPRGTIHLKSTPGTATLALPLTELVVNEVRLQGSRCGPFDKAIALMVRHPFPIANLVETIFPLAEADRALARAETASKVLLACQPSRD
jgi:threonine dehydrogenase-like Zn-dependent dehydrogenase